MISDPTPSILVATALQQVFEICSQLAAEVAPDEREGLDERLRRLRQLRTELVEWVETQRQSPER